MTAVASFFVRDHPVMIADILLSGDERDRDVQLPTVGKHTVIFPKGESGYSIIGLTQKIAIIGDNLAVGWSGKKCLAKHVIRLLRERNQASRFTATSLREFFSGLEDSIQNDAELGFVILGLDQGDFFEFAWRSSSASTNFKNVNVLGTGAGDLARILSEIPPTFGDTALSKERASVATAVLACGNLLMEEIRSGKSLSNYFGGGYEIVLCTDPVITKLPEITFLFWDMEIHGHEVSMSQMPIKAIKLTYEKDFLILRSVHFRGQEGKRLFRDEVFVVEPAYHEGPPPPEMIPKRPPRLQSSWIASFALFNREGKYFIASKLDYSFLGNGPIKFEENENQVQILIRSDFLADWIKNILGDSYVS